MSNQIEVIMDGDVSALTFDRKIAVKYQSLSKLYTDWIKGQIVLVSDNGSVDTTNIKQTDIDGFVKFFSSIDVEFRPRVNTSRVDASTVKINSTFLLSLFTQWVELHKGLDMINGTKLDSIMVAMLTIDKEYLSNPFVLSGYGFSVS